MLSKLQHAHLLSAAGGFYSCCIYKERSWAALGLQLQQPFATVLLGCHLPASTRPTLLGPHGPAPRQGAQAARKLQMHRQRPQPPQGCQHYPEERLSSKPQLTYAASNTVNLWHKFLPAPGIHNTSAYIAMQMSKLLGVWIEVLL